MPLPPLSLYIHVPWCVKKCPYCDFNSHHIGQHSIPQNIEDAYIDSLLIDLSIEKINVQNREISSIFIGGGTPSLLSAAAYRRLFSALKQQLHFADDIEITLEANPGTFEVDKFAAYLDLGINRLSVGVQSFQGEYLTRLGRIHSGEQAINAIEKAKEVGFTRFNIDLMYGLPEQTIEHALFDLQTAIKSGAPHISWYQLTIEPNTEFYKYPPSTPDDDMLWDIQEAGLALLQSHHYHQYEVSAHGKDNEYARHNINYWLFGDYIGIGAGAHGKITHSEDNRVSIKRIQKTRRPEDYMKHFSADRIPNTSSGKSEQIISDDDIAFEYMMNALRLNRAIYFDDFHQYTGQPLSTIESILNKASSLGLITQTNQSLQTTALGRSHLNQLLALFLKDN